MCYRHNGFIMMKIIILFSEELNNLMTNCSVEENVRMTKGLRKKRIDINSIQVCFSLDFFLTAVLFLQTN